MDEIKINADELDAFCEEVEIVIEPESTEVNLESIQDESNPESFQDEYNLESIEGESNPDSIEDESNSESIEDESNPESIEDESNSGSVFVESDTDSEDGRNGISKERRKRSDEDLRTKIWLALQKVETPTAFAFSAIHLSLPLPGLSLPNHGALRLPLSTDDAQKIIAEASQSPFGKGEATIIDTTVRKSWEMNPNQFSLKNPLWNKAIETIANSVSTGLGLKKEPGNVTAQLYKLLLYEPGAFFKAHKDSEKVRGMFGTLVVCLPSPHEGGKLVLTHNDQKYEYETAVSSSYSFSYAGWYSDITHEVQPVTSGYRLVLTYNLIQKNDFTIPKYKLISRRVQYLLTLLEKYESQLAKGEDKLPPILVHKLKHKYTKANLKQKLLKPQDSAQVQTLLQVSGKLGFDIYLATLELIVNTDDEYTSFIEKDQTLENVVELDGKLIIESFKCPKGALIDPKPQDSRKADKEEHEGYTGNEGSPATYWYYDTVVVLVPSSKQLDFIFVFGSNGKVIESQFSQYFQKFIQDPAQTPKLEQLCELALENNAIHSPVFQQALDTAFHLDRIDLFDKACETTEDKIILDNASMLGGWISRNGITEICERLMRGLKIAASVAKKVEFLKSVAEAFETAEQEPSSAGKASLKQWSDEAILTAVMELKTLTTEDAISLAQLCKTINWDRLESKTTQIILKESTMVKIGFIDELVSQQQEHVKERRPFFEIIIRSIWKQFVFDAKLCRQSLPRTSWGYSWLTRDDSAKKDDICHIVATSVKTLTADCVETIIIPSMLLAVPSAVKECAKEFFISLVQKVLKNELVGFNLPTNDAVPPPLHKCLVQALLTKFLIESVVTEPQAPKNWSLPARSCSCFDCSVVNKFLIDPVQQSFTFPCSQKRRVHLNQTFAELPKKKPARRRGYWYSYQNQPETVSAKDCDYSGSTWDIQIIRGTSPNIWQITKHRRVYETAKVEWMKSIETAKDTLFKLKNQEAVEGRLEAYLHPYYSIIMNANVKELPDLNSLVSTSQVVQTNENAAPNQTGQKRAGGKSDVFEDGVTKQGKYEESLGL